MSGYDFDSDEAETHASPLNCIKLFRGKLFPSAGGIRREYPGLGSPERVDSLCAHSASCADIR
jgi:hypothetical protein